jgi:hypothetical protein
MVLKNHVILQNEIPARLHFINHRILPRTITEPDTGQPAIRNVLEFDVDRLNGEPVHAAFSTMAEKLAGKFAGYLPEKTYIRYDFVITQHGEGYQRDWTVQRVPI